MRPIDADVLLEKAWDADTRIGYVQVVDVGDILDAPTVELEQKGEPMDLIERQKAIDALGERPMVWTDDDQYTLGERNQYDRDRLAIEALPCAEKVGRWIPVSERLPEEEVQVLVTDDAGGLATIDVDCGYFDEEYGRFEWFHSQNVTAWMPLPEPYAERREGNG